VGYHLQQSQYVQRIFVVATTLLALGEPIANLMQLRHEQGGWAGNGNTKVRLSKASSARMRADGHDVLVDERGLKAPRLASDLLRMAGEAGGSPARATDRFGHHQVELDVDRFAVHFPGGHPCADSTPPKEPCCRESRLDLRALL
jgi:hypothetical protein